VLVLGVTADDKGAQLEALVRSVLESQGYQRVRRNLVGSGGNELDVVAERESEVVGATQVTPLICEAKAYADPVPMPAWQRFLGKLLLARAEESNTVGILVALNAVNGNVAGSYASLRKRDSAVFVIEGKDLLARAIESGEVGKEEAVRETVTNEFHKESSRLEPAYYGGGFSWVVWWHEDEYSVVDGRGSMLSAERVESLRSALEEPSAGAFWLLKKHKRAQRHNTPLAYR